MLSMIVYIRIIYGSVYIGDKITFQVQACKLVSDWGDAFL